MNIKDIKAFRAAQGCTSDDVARVGIRGVHITPEGEIVATDGHILFKSPDVVEVDGLDAGLTIRPAKLLNKNAKSAEIDTKAGVIITDKEHIRYELIEDKYPDYEQVIPKHKEHEGLSAIGIGTTPALKLLKALDDLKERGNFSQELKLSFGSSSFSPIKITSDDRPGMIALLMPVRI